MTQTQTPPPPSAAGAPAAPFRSLAEAAAAVRALAAGPAPRPRAGAWSAAQVLVHCAMSIEYSLDGFPRLKPAIVRATVGPLVLRRILRRGALSHDRTAHIPGASPPDAGVTLADGAARLLAAIDRFEALGGEPAPHFVFGRVSKADFGRFHALHLADHLAEF